MKAMFILCLDSVGQPSILRVDSRNEAAIEARRYFGEKKVRLFEVDFDSVTVRELSIPIIRFEERNDA